VGDIVSDPEKLKMLPYYFHQDFQILKLELLRDYAQLYAQLDPGSRAKDSSESHLLDLLDGDCWGDVQAGRLLLSAMQCNVDCSQLKSAVEKGHFEIVSDRPVLERNQAVRFSVKFRDPELNLPAALEQLDYQWKFIHPQWDRRFDRRMISWWVRGWERGFSRGYLLWTVSAVIGALLTALFMAVSAPYLPSTLLTFFGTLVVWLILAIIVFVLAWRGFGRARGDPAGDGPEDEKRDETIAEGGKSVWFAWHYFPNAYQYVVRIAISGTTMVKPEPSAAGREAGIGAGDADPAWKCPSNENDKNFNQKPFRCEFDVKVEESKSMQRAGAEFLRFLLAFGAALIALIVGARSQIVKLDTAAAIAALWTLGFTSDALKNLISQGPAASVAAAKRADGAPPSPPVKPAAAAPGPGPATPKNGGSAPAGGQQHPVVESPAKAVEKPPAPASPPAADSTAEQKAKQETEIPVTVRPLEIQFDKGPGLVDPNFEKMS